MSNELSETEKKCVEEAAVKYKKTAEFITFNVFGSSKLEDGYALIARLASGGYLISTEKEIQQQEKELEELREKLETKKQADMTKYPIRCPKCGSRNRQKIVFSVESGTGNEHHLENYQYDCICYKCRIGYTVIWSASNIENDNVSEVVELFMNNPEKVEEKK